MTELFYRSSRNPYDRLTASQAILKGIADDGGLYVPETIPKLSFDWETMTTWTYQDLALPILSAFLSDYSEEELKECIQAAYDAKFDDERIAPIVEVGQEYFLELFHGNTIAFKDMALSILPYLMTKAAKKNHIDKEILILTATSGDTGKAAMAGFANVPKTNIIVFYPKDGVSMIQERQMITQEGDNTFVYSIKGNFDDAQTKVKQLFLDQDLVAELSEKGYQFSSANSINIGRLVPQIVYYFYAYLQLLKRKNIKVEDSINVTVPTGNFGNILAAYYAKQMGLPINKLICASNKNNVLVDFFNEGTYDRRRDFFVTSSPSMDILVSSNLERLLYDISGQDAATTKNLMASLSTQGVYSITDAMKAKLSDFVAGQADEEETAKEIARLFDSYNYLIDPHTAVASAVYHKYQAETGDTTPTVIVSTASPYKFPSSIVRAIDSVHQEKTDDVDAIITINELSKIDIPQAVKTALTAPIRHQKTVTIEEMRTVVVDSLS